MADYDITMTIHSGKCKLIDKQDQNEILGILTRWKSDDLLAAQILVPKRRTCQSDHTGLLENVQATKSCVKSSKGVEEP